MAKRKKTTKPKVMVFSRRKPITVDRSVTADARRFRWLLDGNGYYMEENYLCGFAATSSKENQDDARVSIDRVMGKVKKK